MRYNDKAQLPLNEEALNAIRSWGCTVAEAIEAAQRIPGLVADSMDNMVMNLHHQADTPEECGPLCAWHLPREVAWPCGEWQAAHDRRAARATA